MGKESEWISVKDRLPENSGEYIVVACDEGCPYGEGIWYATVVEREQMDLFEEMEMLDEH